MASLRSLVRCTRPNQPWIRRFSTPVESDPLVSLAGVPDSHRHRRVKISLPAKSAMQSGHNALKLNRWKLEFEKLDGAHDRWSNPLMGWTSTADPLTQLSMSFPTKEAAIQYAQKYGLDYRVLEHHESTAAHTPKAYADNFRWRGYPKTQEE
eukprot:TRINITY_DN362_c0_g1::TRINITY_DN362_c0_g1_i1::g.7535::m.7535 TRINITY_DN362_c0_g1::TRINITY_DN362_c0_g1_i1::g.7535  ORF type:complete len:152 (+),score=16.36,sp/Q66XS7/NDUS4_GEKJA/43.86/2e-24,ETC_C1_NDUFA4/PF04800.7/8.9e-31,DUF2188/PF09954.4/0.033 TRINITY_DN362_c0_g1_i1:41-496(+)